MPILVIHGSFENIQNGDPLTQKVQLSTSPIPVQELELTGYHIQFSDNTRFHPDHIIVELPFLAAQIHVAGPASSVTKKFDHTYGLPLACGGYSGTGNNPNSITAFGMGMKFMVGKDIPRNFDINIKYYDPRTAANGGNDSIIQMSRPAIVPAAPANQVCEVNHVMLYFNYKFVGNF